MCIKPVNKATTKDTSVKKSGSSTSAPSSESVPVEKDASKMKDDGREKMITATHSAHKRNTDYDLLLFLAPALFYKFTPILPVFLIGITRVLSTHLLLTLHYLFVDKDNYNNKIPMKQLHRERDEYIVATILHMWVQVLLQLIFPSMFFSDFSVIPDCARTTFWCHIVIVEPLYYAAHRWLHVPKIMKAMHGFHHLSINTTPSTALVQNFTEHFLYIAVFGPAFFLPFLMTGQQHWVVIGAYLVLFDIINAYGHMNIRIGSTIFNHPLSPLKYLFYTPEFHLGHHAYFNANYALFMPLWDKVFGTLREYKKTDHKNLLPANKQDFVFLGHNGGLGHLLTCPEISIYNVYDKYRRTFLPISVEFLIMHIIGIFARLFIKSYRLSRYLINGNLIGRVVCIPRTPWDFMSPKTYPKMNQELLDVIKDEYVKHGTRYFGLGNLTKMKQLNDGGIVLAEMIRIDPFLKDKDIRIWTGDSLTAASIYHQIVEIPNIKDIFYIGAGGKVGNAVCSAILKNHSGIKICIYSRYEGIKHPNVSYTDNLKDMCNFKVVVVGKFLPSEKYLKSLRGSTDDSRKTKFILDYTVPFNPINFKSHSGIQHIPIGILQLTTKGFLKGSFDICMNHDENHIYPCHAGCIINSVVGRENDEVGEVDLNDMEEQWKRALHFGFQNTIINYD